MPQPTATASVTPSQQDALVAYQPPAIETTEPVVGRLCNPSTL